MQNAWKSENAVKDMIHNRLFKSSRKIIIVIIIYFALKCKDERNKVNIQSEQGGKVVNQHWQPQLKHKNTNPQKSSTDPITVFHKFGIKKYQITAKQYPEYHVYVYKGVNCYSCITVS